MKFMFSIIFMIMSIVVMMMSLNMIIYDYSIMVEWNILSMNSCNMSMTLIFDFMSTMFLSVVTFISSMVILYSGDFMCHMTSQLIDLFMLL